MEYLISGILFFVAGFAAAYFYARLKFQKHGMVDPSEYNSIIQQKEVAERMLEGESRKLQEAEQKLERTITGSTELAVKVSRLEAINQNLEDSYKNKVTEIDELHKKLQQEFESIANKIIIGNSQKIQQQHSDKLTDILNPLKEKITGFEKRVQEVNEQNIRENQSLKEQLKLLQELNKSIGEEARNLTSALKGQVKTQGNWGEMILESILEKSGLEKDREYRVQASHTSEDGKRYQPDVLVDLPEDKSIIIDSKVSLVAYEKLANANGDDEYNEALKEHMTSLKRHIKGLGEKKYQQLYGIKSLDFVLMFIPVEPAFNVAISSDQTIFNDAFDNNIVLVSPSTLLATLRTIASIWKLEYQNRNAREIAVQSGRLYDKFVGFVSDLEKVGGNIDKAGRSYEDAMKKLHTGRGNLVGSIERIKKLGAATSSTIPDKYLNDSEEE